MEQPLPSQEEKLNDCPEYWGVTPAWWDMLMFLWYGGRERTAEDFGAMYEKVGLKLTNVMDGKLGTAIYEGVKA